MDRNGGDDRDGAGALVVGPYRILRTLGRGGQATVHLAEHQVLRNKVALKIIDPQASDPRAIERFRVTAEITARLDHPGICTVFDTGEQRGAHWIAMRYVDGESLSDKLALARSAARSGETSTWVLVPERADRADAPPLPRPQTAPGGPASWAEIARVIAIFEETARALHVAHEAGVIHRDVKPGNVMIAKNGAPVVVDFGLAQDVSGDAAALTVTGELMGTPAYMAPEQLAGTRIRLDRRVDVYALGVSLFECLTTRRPFEAPTREGLYQAIMTKEPQDLRRLNRALPADLRDVVSTAIEKDRDRRYATALDFAEDLRRVRMREPIVARHAGPLVRLARFAARNPALASALGLLFLVLAAGLAVALFLLGQRNRALAEVTTERDARNAALAEKLAALSAVTTERNEKQSALEDYDRLGDLARLERLRAQADLLWPAEPRLVAAMVAWVDQGEALVRRLDGHRAVLAALRRAGRMIAPESRPEDARPADTRPTWRFESDAAQFKHDTTARLVAEVVAFADPDPRVGLLSDVKARLQFAESVMRRTVHEVAKEWDAAIRAIADRDECGAYAGLKIRPQPGLVPIGRDAASGLWEFAHLQTAAPEAPRIPQRAADGRLVITEATGLVFVLIPGGTYRMGAAPPDDDETSPATPNVDGEAQKDEAPVTEVTLSPFFLSKYEMTQGQWLRVTGRNPSQYGPQGATAARPITLANPVEQVTYDDCARWLARLGLDLPTEAQWEYAARAGTSTPRFFGLDRAAFVRFGNVCDAYFKRNDGNPSFQYEAWDDGFAIHAPVGRFAQNPFGLHDVLGNVWEWCRDAYGGYGAKPREDDGLRIHPGSRARVLRGGAFNYSAANARSAVRFNIEPHFRYGNLGVRPARALDVRQ